MSKLANWIAAANETTTTCSVVLADSMAAPKYTYRCLRTDNIQPGDFVITETKGKFKVGKAVEVHDYSQIDINAPFVYGFVYGKVDQDKVMTIKQMEAQQLKLRSNK